MSPARFLLSHRSAEARRMTWPDLLAALQMQPNLCKARRAGAWLGKRSNSTQNEKKAWKDIMSSVASSSLKNQFQRAGRNNADNVCLSSPILLTGNVHWAAKHHPKSVRAQSIPSWSLYVNSKPMAGAYSAFSNTRSLGRSLSSGPEVLPGMGSRDSFSKSLVQPLGSAECKLSGCLKRRINRSTTNRGSTDRSIKSERSICAEDCRMVS